MKLWWHKHSNWDDDVITREKWMERQTRRHREVKDDHRTPLTCSTNEIKLIMGTHTYDNKKHIKKHSHIGMWSVREQSAPYPLLKNKHLQVVGEIDLLTHNHLVQEGGTVQYTL